MNYTVNPKDGFELTLMPKNEHMEILQHIYLIVNSILGECPMYREFGVDMTAKDMPANFGKPLLASAIYTAVSQFEPAVTIDSITWADDAEKPYAMNPILEVSISE